MQKISVSLPCGGYPVLIGRGALEKSTDVLREACPGSHAAVVSDENVWNIYGGLFRRVMNDAGVDFHAIILSPGEESKTLDSVERLFGEFHGFGLTRKDPVIAFGGGVVGDTAGFAAATYMRGVPLIQIPTTLLAQVDSAVGGKVSVNLAAGKNLAGSFYQPVLVISDTGLTDSLPEREWRSGTSEVIKYAALGETRLTPLLETPALLHTELEQAVSLCCQSKAAHVAEDERDYGLRRMLNFGHTFGHAIEALHKYKTYTHGEAVAVGMALAARTATLLGVSGGDTERDVTCMLSAQGISFAFNDTIDKILPYMSSDKKNGGGKISLVLLKEIGRPFIYAIEPERLAGLFREGK